MYRREKVCHIDINRTIIFPRYDNTGQVIKTI